MATTQQSAIFSLYAYASSPANRPDLPSQWVKEKDRTEGTGGFAYAVFRNTSTNEVVIAFRGTDDVADMLTNTGMTIAQERQAAVIAAQYINQYGSGNVSFTGHSMGGGLAATMAVWFNRPATVFDPAPTQAVATDLAVVNSVIGLIGGASAPQSILDYSAALTTRFAARESNVANYYAPGSAVRVISTEANTITGAGQGNALQFGASKMEAADQLYYLHTQVLLTAGMLAPQSFPQATMAVQWALPVVFDKSLYNLPVRGSDRNFLIDMIRSEQQLPGNGKLTHFAADLNKLGTNLQGLNEAAQKALIAQGIEWYYWQSTDYAGQEFFTQTGELMQYSTAKGDGLAGALNNAFSYIDKWLAPIANEHGEFYYPAFGTAYDQWSVAAGSSGVSATARNAEKTQIFLGQSGADTFTGGSKDDVIFAGTGTDTLNGQGGNDKLYGGAGSDTYQFTSAFGKDLVFDTDGQGTIQIDGTTLGTAKGIGTRGAWAFELGGGVYAGLAVYDDARSSTGKRLVITRGADSADTIRTTSKAWGGNVQDAGALTRTCAGDTYIVCEGMDTTSQADDLQSLVQTKLTCRYRNKKQVDIKYVATCASNTRSRSRFCSKYLVAIVLLHTHAKSGVLL